MRAVNLIPSDDRRGGGGAAGKSGGGAYVVLGVLGALVLMVALWSHTGKTLDDKKTQVAAAEQAAAAAEARANALTSYTTFASLRQKRVDTVKQLAATRFDWAHSLRELARVLPTNAWLSNVTGTTSPSATVSGGGGAASGLRAGLAVPALQITGCTTSQASVAKMLARMRLIDGVARVSLQDSTSSADTSGETTGTGAGAACGNSPHYPKFNLVVFYDAQAVTAAASATGTTPVAATTATAAPAAASTATPAAGTTTTGTSTTTPGATTTPTATTTTTGGTP
jgi:Tfp pilus assembly protein PilN